MKSRGTNNDKLPVAETPEDVAVLYSWANLHGAKYRDFSASRREYRAQLRHRAAEQVKEQELQAQAEAEAAAGVADEVAQQAEMAAFSPDPSAEAVREQALRAAAEATRIATAERIEAERRADAAATAAAAAEREQQEIAEANASARRQAESYSKLARRQGAADENAEQRRRREDSETRSVPGEISDPYSDDSHLQQQRPTAPTQLRDSSASRTVAPRPFAPLPLPPLHTEPIAPITPRPMAQPAPLAPIEPAYPSYIPQPAARQTSSSSSRRRPQGYTPDDASGVRQIYRAPEFSDQDEYVAGEPSSEGVRVRGGSPYEPVPSDLQPAADLPVAPELKARRQTSGSGMTSIPGSSPAYAEQYRPAANTPLDLPYASRRPVPPESAAPAAPIRVEGWSAPTLGRLETPPDSQIESNRRARTPFNPAPRREGDASFSPLSRATPPRSDAPAAPETPYDAGRSRRGSIESRAQADFEARRVSYRTPATQPASGAQRPQPEPAGPAWLYSPQSATPPAQPAPPAYVQPSVADTLQQSRERVAARWYALKGVFEQPGQEPQEQPIRQKETRTPSLAVFSLAGGVGKTCLVATLGRALSSMGEKVLLTDTTSHGLLPFYFGASELRQGTVRTFSPPSGSTDAPIYLVSHDIDQYQSDNEGQEQLIEQILENSKGTHRILLDLNSNTGWIARRMARLSPTVLVPVAPDMNSVISLQAVEKFFQGTSDADGKPIQPHYVLSQFDASLPLHLDVREVLRRQLGDRLLPFVIRRAPAVSEALAEGMTVVDYAPDAPVAEDYQNVANWLRSIAAPATAGFRNVRWSER